MNSEVGHVSQPTQKPETVTVIAPPCAVCDFENAKLLGRARWCCPKCGRDFSLEYLFWAEAAHPEWFDEAGKS